MVLNSIFFFSFYVLTAAGAHPPLSVSLLIAYYYIYIMGFMLLGPSSSLLCQDVNCVEHFPDRPVICPRIGKPSGSFHGKAFIVVSNFCHYHTISQ